MDTKQKTTRPNPLASYLEMRRKMPANYLKSLAFRIDLLDQEADRFTELAKDISLVLLKEPFAPYVEKNKRLALDHLIRAATYRDAARIVAGGIK